MQKGEYNAMLQEAREHPDLKAALQKIGISIKPVGRTGRGGIRYSTGAKSGHDGDYSSLAFIENPGGTWVVIDNKQRNGKLSYDALGALTELFGQRFADAVQLLSSGGIASAGRSRISGTASAPSDPVLEKAFCPPQRADSAKHAAAYLTKARGIRGNLVSELLHRGMIYESVRKSPDGKELPMVIFPSFDENKKMVGAECCSAYSSVRFKHIVGGSDPRFGWRFSVGKSATDNRKLFFCESAIDAMSLYCLTGAPGVYISLAGLKDETLLHMKQLFGGEAVICVDNDAAGEKFRQKHPDFASLLPKDGKDWNDQLKALQGAGTAASQPPSSPATELAMFRPAAAKL